ncbi:MAG TPA: DUF2961 domain-containing protein [Opitutaceae bacterium]|nr:DUF2961 domain-containing protein [Opitutaceae bacterium]HND59913.1 DUF2961 domain-containing protein [Opitutaceae bacterium]
MRRLLASLSCALLLSAAALGQGAPSPASSLGGLRDLPNLREGVKRGRVSSYDRTGGNHDYLSGIGPGQKATLAELSGAGTVTHIWVTISSPEMYHLRRIVLRAYWDGEADPSIEAPIGDFFGLGFGEPNYWASAPLAVADRAMNCFFPMPFSRGARIEIENQGEKPIGAFYYYVDYESYVPGSAAAKATEGQGRFHAWWHRERTKATDGAPNVDGKNNYLIMEAKGRGHYVGVVLHIQALSTGWWGEGDDMMTIDGDARPTLNGTGLEDYFAGAWNFNLLNREYNFPYFGYSRKGNAHPDYTGRHSMYRFHLEDPVTFDQSIRVSIEHGTNNNRGDDYSSVAYWYQTEPHLKFPPLPPVAERLPIDHWTAVPDPVK